MKSKYYLFITSITLGLIFVFVPISKKTIYVPNNCPANQMCMMVTGSNQEFVISGIPLNSTYVNESKYIKEYIPFNMFINFSLGFIIPIFFYYGVNKLKGNK